MERVGLVAVLLFALLVSAMAVTIAFAAPPPGIVSWWPGEGSANDTVDGNNGTLSGGATFAPGQVGQAFQLDGMDGFVDVGNAANLWVSGGDFTVETWVRFNALTGDMSLMDKMSASGANPNTDGWRLVLQRNDNRFWFCMGGGGGNGCVAGYPTTVRGTTPATTGAWFHVAGVKASGAIKMYVNGALEAEQGLGPFQDSDSANLRVGANVREGSYLNGLIDEPSIYNRALTDAEIKAIYDAGSAGKGTIQPPTAVTLTSLGASSGIGAWPAAVAPIGLAVAVAAGLMWRRRKD